MAGAGVRGRGGGRGGIVLQFLSAVLLAAKQAAAVRDSLVAK